MKLKNFLINFSCILYLEFVFEFLLFDTYTKSTIINIFLFSFIISLLITIITGLFNKKINKIFNYIIYGLLGFYFSLQFILKKVFGFFFSFDLFKLSDQVLKFGRETILSILRNFHFVILLFLPLIIFIIFRKKINFERSKLVNYLSYLGLLIISFTLFILNINSQKEVENSIYYLYTSINDTSLNNEKLGVINSGVLDLYRNIFGFDENVQTVINIDNSDDVFEYDYNKIDIDFDSLETNNSDIKKINNYMSSIEPTKQNKYTGIFEGKNLIYIVAESFNEIGVREDLTPTLYKLVNSGFKFNNYYSSNNLSTIGGEFQALTGLYANSSILPIWRKGINYFPYGLANVFKNMGYKTYAYHDHYYNFQDRNKYLKSLGFDNYKGCYNGLETKIKCNIWPEFDTEMIKATTDDYLNSDDPFMVYYMTVSGHLEYNFYNEAAKKHASEVKSLPYSDRVRAYLATQIELNDALELLINTLEEKGKLDDTVIVLLADHYPYGLTVNEINEASSYKKDGIIGVNNSNLIIWNSKMKTVEVDKVGMSIDVLPTVYNLFNIKYDSRLFAGSDILSSREGIAIFSNRSWVTDKGKYFGSDNNFVKNEDVDENYIKNINIIMNNKISISKLIVKNDYYNYLKNNDIFKNN